MIRKTYMLFTAAVALCALAAFSSTASASPLTHAQAKAAVQAVGNSQLGTDIFRSDVRTSEVTKCVRSRKSSWVCQLHQTGIDTTFVSDENGARFASEFSSWVDYRVTGTCKRTVVRIQRDYIEAPHVFRGCL